ncbi:hypothetical protein NPIL_262171 [Nephila pilipes]|uniref:Uncharacterized protein n=1 Tax=Nephila pilipes TaxID=299642 RepID=A0A8X6PP20_NEPPI|nr:hypothetical protein NPIL_262171 [Nephila pilipes]
MERYLIFKGKNTWKMFLIHNAFQVPPRDSGQGTRRPSHGKFTINYSNVCEMLMQDILVPTSDVWSCTILHENTRIDTIYLLPLRYHKVLQHIPDP